MIQLMLQFVLKITLDFLPKILQELPYIIFYL
nr:MAG TPA: hypothetical protein [Caudoviricetes sp.]